MGTQTRAYLSAYVSANVENANSLTDVTFLYRDKVFLSGRAITLDLEVLEPRTRAKYIIYTVYATGSTYF